MPKGRKKGKCVCLHDSRLFTICVDTHFTHVITLRSN